MKRFFINTGDGFEFADTEEEAKKAATEAIEFWRRDAIGSGEWDSEVSSVYWGEIRERALEIAVETEDESDRCDYQLRPVE